MHCIPDDISANFRPELTAYVNTQDMLYIRIENVESDHDYSMEHICLDADTAEDLARDLLKMVKELRNGGF